MNVISSSKITKISWKVIAMKLICYETASKNIHMITFLGDSENIYFSSCLHVHYLKVPKSRKYHRKGLLWNLYIMNQHQKYTCDHIFRRFWEQRFFIMFA